VGGLGDLACTIELTDSDENVVASVSGVRRIHGVPTDVAYITAPIEDPRRDAPVGAVGVTCAAADAGAFVLPYAQLAARAIGERLNDGAAVADRTLLETFLRARRRVRGPVVGINGSQMLTNGAAARLVGTGDHSQIWNWAMRALAEERSTPCELPLHATVIGYCEPVRLGSETVGALIFFAEDSRSLTSLVRAPAGPAGRAKFGWESLRESELGIAKLVAEGLTNRQVAARLFVSPHTVDFHLRQIFRKLSIATRIELTRLVLEHAATPDSEPGSRGALRPAS
jgi:DNA-binding CsgD family transcriptional regulator